jgi:predicted transcriptional regulator
MFQKKLPMDEVHRLLAEGKNQSQIARELGFSKQAVSQALQDQQKRGEAGNASGSLVPARIGGPKGVSDFEGLKRLKRIMSPVFDEIKLLNSEIGKMQDERITSEERKHLNFQRLKYVGEARKQLQLALLIDEKRFEFSEVVKFQNFILEQIGEVDEGTRNEILDRIRRGKSIRNLLGQS